MLAAGLDGIDAELDLPPEASNNIYEMSEAERHAAGIDSLPEDLVDAIRLAADSKVLWEALGEHVHGVGWLQVVREPAGGPPIPAPVAAGRARDHLEPLPHGFDRTAAVMRSAQLESCRRTHGGRAGAHQGVRGSGPPAR